MVDPINSSNPTGPPTTSSGYIIGSQDPLSPYYQGTSYWGGRTPQNFTPSGSSDGRVTSGGYTIGSQNPSSRYYQGSSYWGGSATDGRYLADEFQRELVSRGNYSTDPVNRGSYPGSDGTLRQPVNHGTPHTRTGASPVNRGSGGVSGGRTTNPGRPVNPRIPGGVGGIASVGAAVLFGGGGAFERVGMGVGGAVGFNQGSAAGLAAGTAAGTVTLPGVGTVGLGGAGAVAGGIAGAGVGGAIGGRIGRTIDNAIPDFPLPWPFNGGDEEYPNQTDPDSIPQGPQTQAPTPAQPGEPGSVAGAAYRVFTSYEAYPSYQRIPEVAYDMIGPLASVSSVEYYSNGLISFEGVRIVDVNGVRATKSGTAYFNTGTVQHRNFQARIERTDGGTDPPAVPEQPAVYAPNPARSNRPTVPGGVPNLLPDPPINAPGYDPGSDTPWPGVEPTTPPDTQPIAPAPDAPPGFQPSAPAGAPNTPTNPNAPPGPPDLDPNAPPRDAPNLADDPDTPTQPVGSPGGSFGGAPTQGPQEWPKITKLPDGTEVIDQENGDRQIIWPPGTSHEDAISKLNPPVLPVPVPVGTAQPANTPSPPNLVPRTPTNPNVQQVQQPVRQTPTEAPKGTCFYEFQRVADIQRKATSTEQRAANPTSGFTGLYGIGIESRLKLGETFTLLQTVNEFMRKAWRATRMDKVLNLLTFIGVMHNVSMLSRDVGETFFQLISQALQAVGIRDEEDNVIDVGEVVGNTVENFLKTILGESTYNGINDAWNKANRIISSASSIIWTVRSIADSSLDLMEWIGENTGRIGNALKRWGVVGERSYPWMSESARAQGRWRSRFSKLTNTLDNAEDRLSVYMQATSTVIEVQEETQELGEQWGNFRQSVEDGIPDPWADNDPIASQYAADQAVSDGPDVPPADAQKGT